jgi:hypothetical protein
VRYDALLTDWDHANKRGVYWLNTPETEYGSARPDPELSESDPELSEFSEFLIDLPLVNSHTISIVVLFPRI